MVKYKIIKITRDWRFAKSKEVYRNTAVAVKNIVQQEREFYKFRIYIKKKGQKFYRPISVKKFRLGYKPKKKKVKRRKRK